MNFEQTKYPKIFENVYWAKSPYNPEEEAIIENRNEFVRQFDIKKRCKRLLPLRVTRYTQTPFGNRLPHIDHLEVYNDGYGNFVLVSSPYDGERFEEIYKKHDWIEFKNLYSNRTKTFVKFVFKNEEREVEKEYHELFVKEKVERCMTCKGKGGIVEFDIKADEELFDVCKICEGQGWL